jgi:hypothetical protein
MSEVTVLAEPEPAAATTPSFSGPVSRQYARSKSTFAFYALTVFLSAFLLFQVQLIEGKYILPMFGGSPAVWTTCMLCFQLLLLFGYCYSHFLSSRLKPGAQTKVHGTLLGLSLIVLVLFSLKWGSSLTPGAAWRPGPTDNPVWKILELLAVTIAFPFFLLSTTGPLLQKWWSQDQAATSPYRLYALSNAGSLLGLLSYPFLIEWAFDIKHQAWLWSAGYSLFVVTCTALAWKFSRSASEVNSTPNYARSNEVTASAYASPESKQSPTAAHYLLWLALSACSTTMLLATTNLLCQDLATIPLLWVLPLAIYLGTFILTFDSDRWYRRSVFWPLFFFTFGFAIKINLFGNMRESTSLMVLSCIALTTVCMVCHGELAFSKPSARYLTPFYLMVAGGGVLAGIFVVLVAPHLFLSFREFHVALIACGLLIFAAFVLKDPTGNENRQVWTANLILLTVFLIPHIAGLIPGLDRIALLSRDYDAGLLVLAVFLIVKLFQGRRNPLAAVAPSESRFPWQPVVSVCIVAVFGILVYAYSQLKNSHIIFRERNFYGIKSVVDERDDLKLINGSIVHGLQLKNPSARHVPTAYYEFGSGVGALLKTLPRSATESHTLRVGAVGMGVGTLAAYGEPGDYYRFYEIDPAVIDLSTGNRPYFSFVRDSRAKVDVVLGDARVSLEAEGSRGDWQRFDVLVVDAFSGDAVPVHLLTREATALYLRHMRNREGVLAFHVTNRHLDFEPVLAALADYYHLTAVRVANHGTTWIMLTANAGRFAVPVDDMTGKSLGELLVTKRRVLWTDSYSNLFQVMMRQPAS